jgi:tetratricopeptide (TPR) repeat protein
MKFLRRTALYVCAIVLHAGAQQSKQGWQELHEAGLASCQTGHYDEALAIFKAALPLAQTAEQHAMTLGDIGYSLGDLGRDAEAIDQLQNAFAAWRSIDPAGTGAAETAIGLAHEQQRIERFLQAERTLRSALDDKPREEASTAALFNALGDLINQPGRFPEARQAFETALRLSTSKGNNRVLALIGLGNVERSMRDWQSSIHHLTEALELSRDAPRDGIEAVALRTLGNTYADMGDSARAEPLLRRALAQFEGVPMFSLQYAATLVSLGVVYGRERKRALAEDALQRALKVQGEVASSDSRAIPPLEYLAALLAGERRFDEAAKYANRAFQIAQATFGDSGPPVASAVGRVAFVEERSGDFENAEHHFAHALQIVRQNGLDNSDESLFLMTHYAAVLRKLHKSGEAKHVEAEAKAFRSATQRAR